MEYSKTDILFCAGYTMINTANIIEIFSSMQGEGPHTSEMMTFVRFAGCSLGCRWCDTDTALNESKTYRVETPPASRHFVEYANPVTIEKLNEQIAYFTDPTLSLTGGEPLEHADFIALWLESKRPERKILLETNGVFADALAKVARHIDIISMDIKIPSSTGKRHLWREHAMFLSKAIESGKETYVKLVLTPDTSSKDLQEAIKLIASANKYMPVIIQPASVTDRFSLKIDAEQLNSFARLCKAWLPNVSIMSQVHKELKIL